MPTDMELLVKPPAAVYSGDGGSYYAWLPSDSPILGETNVGASKFVLPPLGFALPHYADSSKVGLVIRGTGGVAEVFMPQRPSEGAVVRLKEGDVIPVPVGTISWWFNDGGRDNTDLVIVFLGVTPAAYIPGLFTYFFLAGSQSIMAGLSTEVICGAYGMDAKEAAEFAKSQLNPPIIKLEDHTRIGQLAKTEAISGRPKHIIQGKSTMELTTENMPLLELTGMSVQWNTLEANAVIGPSFTADSSTRLFYMVAGSGRVEILGINGKTGLNKEVKEGELVVIPKFFAFSAIAGEHGMECATIASSPRPLVVDLAGKASPLKALCPAAMEAAFNVSPLFYKGFLEKTGNE